MDVKEHEGNDTNGRGRVHTLLIVAVYYVFETGLIPLRE
jgi:hypothetical protein